MNRSPRTATPPDLWDPVVRISHWGLAIIVLLNAVFTSGGGTVHVWLGWIGMALLVMRLVWGVLGPSEARFAAFPPNPRAAVSHLGALVSGRVGQYASHNPAGAMMIYAFWAALAVIIGTGLVMTDGATPMQVAADQAAVESGDWSLLIKDTVETPATGIASENGQGGEAGEKSGRLIKEVHEMAANLILILAFLHIAGVAVESRAMRRNLVAPMLGGRRGKTRK
jgi:cytochrome b